MKNPDTPGINPDTPEYPDILDINPDIPGFAGFLGLRVVWVVVFIYDLA